MLFEQGQEVLLAIKNIRVIRPSKKLSAKYLRPFKIIKLVGRNTYRLDLPYSIYKIHDVFYASLLEPY